MKISVLKVLITMIPSSFVISEIKDCPFVSLEVTIGMIVMLFLGTIISFGINFIFKPQYYFISIDKEKFKVPKKIFDLVVNLSLKQK